MKLTDIRLALERLGVSPSKTLGQNFLHDGNLARWFVAQVDPRPGDHIVEIGPGLGALTEHLLASGATLTAIEKDGRLAGHLRERFADAVGAGQLEVIHGDALEFDVRTLWPRQPVKVIGNVPYYISTPLLFRFTAPESPAARVVFIMQRELVERLGAGPERAEDFGIPSLLIQRRWRVQALKKTLPASVFLPAPKVESGAVRLTPRAPDELPACDGETFDALVRRGFSQRRKQLGKLLEPLLPGRDGPPGHPRTAAPEAASLPWGEITARLGVSPTARAEELDLERWIALTNLIRPMEPATAQDGPGERFDVVDEANGVIGMASRAEVHARGLRHRAMHIFVHNAAGELFLQKRSPWKDRHPGKWDSSAAGHLDAGETYEAAARRELGEELGLDAGAIERAGLHAVGDLGEARLSTGWEFIRLFAARAEGPFRWPPAEVEWGGFFPLTVIAAWIVHQPGDFAPGFLDCWELFRARPQTPR